MGGPVWLVLGKGLGAAVPTACAEQDRGDIAVPQKLGPCYHRRTIATGSIFLPSAMFFDRARIALIPINLTRT